MRTKLFLLTPTRKLARLEDVKKLESRFSMVIPEYLEFMENFGEGTISNAVRVYPPQRILAETEAVRKRWADYFLWDDANSELTAQDLIDAVPIADSLDGDEVAFVPCKNALYILPRHNDRAKRIGGDLSSAIEYICNSGEIYSDVDFLYFESWENRVNHKLFLEEQRFDFDLVLSQLKQIEHIHLSVSKEDDYISILCPQLEGSVSIFGEEAIIFTVSGIDPTPVMSVLQSLGYSA